MKHVVSSDQFNHDLLEELFRSAENMFRSFMRPKSRHKLMERHRGQLLFNIFYEPSTRTRLSFDTAAQYLGMLVSSAENASDSSSSAKGESLSDSIMALNQYHPSVIVLRHPKVGAAAEAASSSSASIINAGDGSGEHPTQALLDAYTVYKKFGRLSNLHIVVGGDLKNGRTARSFVKLLSQYEGNHFTFVAESKLAIKKDILTMLQKKKITYSQTSALSKALSSADVVYWTRLQVERLGYTSSTQTSKLIIDAKSMKKLPSHAIVLHPLPRINEISTDIDSDSRTLYFKQVENGLFIRMALLDYILS